MPHILEGALDPCMPQVGFSSAIRTTRRRISARTLAAGALLRIGPLLPYDFHQGQASGTCWRPFYKLIHPSGIDRRRGLHSLH
jgi:hypothetical protein